MIDASRWTGNERSVVIDALRTEREMQRKRKQRSHSPIVASDAQWRLVVIGQALDDIDRT